MIKSNTKLKFINFSNNIEEFIQIEPRFENIVTDLQREVYVLQSQIFYLKDDVKFPIELVSLEINISDVYEKTGSLTERIELTLLDKIKELKPFGSKSTDWERETTE